MKNYLPIVEASWMKCEVPSANYGTICSRFLFIFHIFILAVLSKKASTDETKQPCFKHLSEVVRNPVLFNISNQHKLYFRTMGVVIDSFRPDGCLFIKSPCQPKSLSESSSSYLRLALLVLIHESATVLSSPSYSFHPFEMSWSVTLLLNFNTCQSPASSSYSAKPSGFLQEYYSCLLLSPHLVNVRIVLIGDFNIHVDNPYDPVTSAFSALRSDPTYSFPIHKFNHIYPWCSHHFNLIQFVTNPQLKLNSLSFGSDIHRTWTIYYLHSSTQTTFELLLPSIDLAA